jgi:hypothetical protein
MPKPYTEWKNGLRECTNCGSQKTEEDYSWRNTPSGGRILNSMCKECLAERHRERAKIPQTKEMMRKASQKYYHQGGGCEKERDRRYLAQYGITNADKERMIEKNHWLCPICGTDNPGRWWAIDHCHRTGKVRDVICDKCNKMLGLANDDPCRLWSAAMYLVKHGLDRTPVTGVPNVPKPDEEREFEAQLEEA